MSEIDENLLDAFHRVGEWLKTNPHAAALRYERGMRMILRRPATANCLVIRASDTRLEGEYDFVQPSEAAEKQEPHHLVICHELVRAMCGPVYCPWPGVHYHEAAKKLGMTVRAFYQWIERGVVRHSIERFHGLGMPPSPRVWWDGAINPNFHDGRRPLEMWGDVWEVHWRAWPEGLEQQVLRVPRYRPHWGVETRRGWDFLCPGRPRADGAKLIPCGRQCGRLYAPVPPMTLAEFYGLTPPVELYQPVKVDPWFACNKCWNPFYDDQSNPEAMWNKFVAHVSGGLLKGSEVTRPEDLQMKRKKPVPERELPLRVRPKHYLGPVGTRRKHKHIDDPSGVDSALSRERKLGPGGRLL